VTTRRPWPLCVFCGVKLHRRAIRVYVKSADAWRCKLRGPCAERVTFVGVGTLAPPDIARATGLSRQAIHLRIARGLTGRALLAPHQPYATPFTAEEGGELLGDIARKAGLSLGIVRRRYYAGDRGAVLRRPRYAHKACEEKP
jgi:hypothetical protein